MTKPIHVRALLGALAAFLMISGDTRGQAPAAGPAVAWPQSAAAPTFFDVVEATVLPGPRWVVSPSRHVLFPGGIGDLRSTRPIDVDQLLPLVSRKGVSFSDENHYTVGHLSKAALGVALRDPANKFLRRIHQLANELHNSRCKISISEVDPTHDVFDICTDFRITMTKEERDYLVSRIEYLRLEEDCGPPN